MLVIYAVCNISNARLKSITKGKENGDDFEFFLRECKEEYLPSIVDNIKVENFRKDIETAIFKKVSIFMSENFNIEDVKKCFDGFDDSVLYSISDVNTALSEFEEVFRVLHVSWNHKPSKGVKGNKSEEMIEEGLKEDDDDESGEESSDEEEEEDEVEEKRPKSKKYEALSKVSEKEDFVSFLNEVYSAMKIMYVDLEFLKSIEYVGYDAKLLLKAIKTAGGKNVKKDLNMLLAFIGARGVNLRNLTNLKESKAKSELTSLVQKYNIQQKHGGNRVVLTLARLQGLFPRALVRNRYNIAKVDVNSLQTVTDFDTKELPSILQINGLQGLFIEGTIMQTRYRSYLIEMSKVLKSKLRSTMDAEAKKKSDLEIAADVDKYTKIIRQGCLVKEDKKREFWNEFCALTGYNKTDFSA